MGKPNRNVGPVDFGREAIFWQAQFIMALLRVDFARSQRPSPIELISCTCGPQILTMTPAY